MGLSQVLSLKALCLIPGHIEFCLVLVPTAVGCGTLSRPYLGLRCKDHQHTKVS